MSEIDVLQGEHSLARIIYHLAGPRRNYHYEQEEGEGSGEPRTGNRRNIHFLVQHHTRGAAAPSSHLHNLV